ncbi:MAG: hypothetical protein CL710_01260 [Chloroflexi bacterium]|nr:hypothetical protein [Chloroflexota bacterium]|tara:strand:- start:157 stop:600 length:444 start_codon:yes stop_codon:yes gene_type:complete
MNLGNLITLNGTIALEELTEKNNILLIYFSEHNTPMCTKQLLSFNEEFETIKKFDIVGYAVSTDSLHDIDAFTKQFKEFPFTIASDKDGSIAKKLNIYDYEQKKANRSIIILNKKCEIVYSNLFYQPDNINDFINVFEYINNNLKLR